MVLSTLVGTFTSSAIDYDTVQVLKDDGEAAIRAYAGCAEVDRRVDKKFLEEVIRE